MSLSDEELTELAAEIISKAEEAERTRTCLLCDGKAQDGYPLVLRNVLWLGDDFGSHFHDDCWCLYAARYAARSQLTISREMALSAALELRDAEMVCVTAVTTRAATNAESIWPTQAQYDLATLASGRKGLETNTAKVARNLYEAWLTLAHPNFYELLDQVQTLWHHAAIAVMTEGWSQLATKTVIDAQQTTEEYITKKAISEPAVTKVKRNQETIDQYGALTCCYCNLGTEPPTDGTMIALGRELYNRGKYAHEACIAERQSKATTE